MCYLHIGAEGKIDWSKKCVKENEKNTLKQGKLKKKIPWSKNGLSFKTVLHNEMCMSVGCHWKKKSNFAFEKWLSVFFP